MSFEDGFDLQDEIVAEVLKGLDVKLASGQWLLHSSIRSLQALDVFYRGLSRFYAGTKNDNAATREAFETLAACRRTHRSGRPICASQIASTRSGVGRI